MFSLIDSPQRAAEGSNTLEGVWEIISIVSYAATSLD